MSRTTASRALRGGIPAGREPKLTIRIIHTCDLKCPACSTFSEPRRGGRLRLADLRRAVELLAAAHFRGVINISGGETTMHTELARMLRFASAQLPDTHIALFTNGEWVGRSGWRRRLRRYLVGPNVLLRFSIDRQHAIGLARAQGRGARGAHIAELEAERLRKAGLFMRGCLEEGARPGRDFDFAFKGSEVEARAYARTLGEVPLYLIPFQARPARRPKRPGFFALDVDERDRAQVYLTLGHIPTGEVLGGVEALPEALVWNRRALRRGGGGRA